MRLVWCSRAEKSPFRVHFPYTKSGLLYVNRFLHNFFKETHIHDAAGSQTRLCCFLPPSKLKTTISLDLALTSEKQTWRTPTLTRCIFASLVAANKLKRLTGGRRGGKKPANNKQRIKNIFSPTPRNLYSGAVNKWKRLV